MNNMKNIDKKIKDILNTSSWAKANCSFTFVTWKLIMLI